ncbi:hypothetical protein AAH446_00110 [Erwinia sp. P6884]|uniref:hypothetical protein n=1 Tax=Erwinia sp. P6884 TaxID=3141450 RepID=UPI00318A98C7
MHVRRKHQPFSSLSRRIRRRQVIRLKNLIHKERHRCGGIFYDECDFNRFDDEPGYIWSWSDIYFTGLDPATFWNAEIITAQVAFRDAVHARAFDEAWERLSEPQRECEVKIETRPDYNASGKIVSHTLIPREASQYDAFNGLTFSEYVKKREQEISRDEPPVFYRRYELLPGYAYGSGLRMIVDASALSQKAIEDAIADFRLHGECDLGLSESFSF